MRAFVFAIYANSHAKKWTNSLSSRNMLNNSAVFLNWSIISNIQLSTSLYITRRLPVATRVTHAAVSEIRIACLDACVRNRCDIDDARLNTSNCPIACAKYCRYFFPALGALLFSFLIPIRESGLVTQPRRVRYNCLVYYLFSEYYRAYKEKKG